MGCSNTAAIRSRSSAYRCTQASQCQYGDEATSQSQAVDEATLLVSMLSGHTMEIKACLKQDNLHELKRKIIEHMQLQPFHQLKFMLDDRLLEDDLCALSDHRIQDRSSICVLISNDAITDRHALICAVRQNALSLQHGSEELRADPKMIAYAVQSDVSALQFASKSLRVLTLSFMFQRLPFIEAFTIDLSKLQALETLDLSFSSTDMDTERLRILGMSLQKLARLQCLKLDFSETSVTSADELGDSIGRLQMLQYLDINFFNDKLDSIDVFGANLGQAKKLQRLTFNFTGLYAFKFASLVGLSQGIRQLHELEALSLKFGGIFGLGQYLNAPPGISSVDELGHAVAELHSLKTLTLSFEGCHLLTSITGFSQALVSAVPLQEMHVDLQDCSGLPQPLQVVWFSQEDLSRAVSTFC